MEMEIRRIPDGTDKVTTLAELVYKYARNLAEVNGVDTGEVLLKAVARCMTEVKPGTAENDDNDVIIVESTSNDSAPSTSTCQHADKFDHNKKTEDAITRKKESDDSKQTTEKNSSIDSSTSVTSKQSSMNIIDKDQLIDTEQKNDKDKKGDGVLDLEDSDIYLSSKSTNGRNERLDKKEDSDKVSIDDKDSSSGKNTDLDYEVIYLDDVNDLVNDKTEVVIGDENTPAENDKSDHYFDMDCDEIDENPAEEEEEIQNTKESSVGEKCIDEPDIMIIDDEDNEHDDKTKVKITDLSEASSTNTLQQKQQDQEIVNEIVVESTTTLLDKAELSAVKIESDMVPKLDEVEVIDIDSDSDDIKSKKYDEKTEKKPEESVKPVSIVGFFTNKAKFAEDKLIGTLKESYSTGKSDFGSSHNLEEQPVASNEDNSKNRSEDNKNVDEIENMNALGLVPIKKGEIPAKYRTKLETEARVNSIKRSFSEHVEVTEDHSSFSIPETEGSSSPKMKRRLLDFDKKWHMVPKYSPDQEKYLARPGGIEANVYNGDLTQHVMPAVSHMVGTEFRKPGLYTSFSSFAPNIVIETVNSNTPMNYSSHQNYSDYNSCQTNVNEGELEYADSPHSSRSQKESRSNIKKNSFYSAKLPHAKKDLGKSLSGTDELNSDTDQYSESDQRKARTSGKFLNLVKNKGSSQDSKGNVTRLISRGRGLKRGFGKARGRASKNLTSGSFRGRGSRLRLSVSSKGSKRGRGSTSAPVTSSRGSFKSSIRGRGPKRKTVTRDSVRQTDSSSDSDSSDSESDSSDTDSSSSDSDTDGGKNMKSKINSARGSARGRGSRGSVRGRGYRKGSYANGLLNLAQKLKNKPDLKNSKNVSKNEKPKKPQESKSKTSNSNLKPSKVNKANITKSKASLVNIKTKETNGNIANKQLAVCVRKTAMKGKAKSLSDTSKTIKSAKSNDKVPNSRAKKEHTKKVKYTQLKQDNSNVKKPKKSINVKVTDNSELENIDSDLDVIVLD